MCHSWSLGNPKKSFSKSSTSVKYLMLFHIDRVTKYTTMINQHSADRKNDLVALHSS